ncbi:MAG: threonylcarbamoyl-AMP synthase [Myxococcales bacterium]|nr:threonylcarbamoyl-AMP synthase [Myxococcales bacterium]
MGGHEPGAVERAAALLRAGQLVAFPTETVYGLGANAFDAAAVAKIFEAKERPPDNPLIVHVADIAGARAVAAAFPPLAERAAAALWPGSLTMVLPRGPKVPDIVAAGGPTVAVRVPAHPVAWVLLRVFGRPIAAPSANLSGRPSPTQASHVLADLDGRVALILDSGPTSVGLESTVVDMTRPRPLLLRRGGVTIERLRQVLGPVDVLDEQDPKAVLRSPGLRHRHYAPKAMVELVAEGEGEAAAARAIAAGQKVALIVRRTVSSPALVRKLANTPEGFARALFTTLRELDELDVERIVIESLPETGLGAAIMDRLRRAAQG